ncbi:uncharacterized protein LOC129942370 isoform X2 [Eupeodes corollae]|uniref:uncharacterized protein LOC129942370 isoform X2 n=1 Tax=Eupeodes corollae TaxID=290404 RepID=UPI002492B007|nr:uncharacterized protein LOC129942370 isoform X2 [Eupeodes corollae]
MQIIEVNDREKLSTLVIQELKEIGVKYRKDKKIKPSQEKTCRKRIFRTHLHLLELTDVILASGSVVQIPRFVADACNRILEHVETEGLFRKAGSSLRQKEIRISLEAGLPLGKTHHVIDVANVVKSFFRELPEPLLPSYIQETLLRSLLIGDNRIKAILLAILLLPPLTINTLSFFLQFLNTVSLYSHMNKMPVENLAIIFTPGLMPFPDIASLRFNNHVKMVQLLIENAHAIGTVPECIVDKLHIHEIFSKTSGKSKSVEALDVKKKKKRRSEMFNGLRKMVGGAIGSAENLGHTPEATKTPPMVKNPVAATPCLSKSSKKRKFADPVCAFSAKKKKDLLALLPSNSGGFLPNTPLIKESKKTRLSLGGRRQTKKTSPAAPALPSMERRWSIVGSGWPRNKKTDKKEPTSTITKPLSPVASMPCISKLDFPRVEFPVIEQTSFVDSSVPDSTTADVEKNTSETSDGEFVRVPKNYYESIIERVSAIETRMSQEFGKIQSSLSSGDDLDLSMKQAHLSNDDRLNCSMSGLERVLNEYEQTKEETERLTSPYTENLAKRLSRELKIRRSSEHRVIRSPSARKIGTMRRRSREAARLTRNKTWHDSSTSEKPTAAKQVILYPPKATQDFCSKCNLKRGRPNTLHTGLPQQCTPTLTPVDDKKMICPSPRNPPHTDEKWTAGEVFFDSKKPLNFDMEHKSLEECIPSTPVTAAKPEPFAEMKTPMLPPRSIRRKAMGNNRTPASAMRLVSTRILATPGEDEINGRASIARLRTQNAGMVMAKAKLFDGLGGNENENIPPATPTTHTTNNRRRSIRLPAAPLNLKNKIDDVKLPPTDESPSVRKKNNTAKSPGYIQKRQRLCLAAKVPSKQFLDSMVNEENLLSKMSPLNVSFKNISNQNRGSNNSPRTPKKRTNHFGGVNSPRRGRNPNSAGGGSRRRTPHKQSNTPGAGTRKSPRYVKATGRT